ncbi:lipase family alpha/beta hydrolase [Jatrophihabitans sp.]|uniref:lipase family alpha/beta hydrolase n=1 Tax=Jatrophihabitans sp. TaxID=1932789 RepID=UPI002CB40943|nr:alpha/beta fold hydrolase [Jatrophihabitans sp.]
MFGSLAPARRRLAVGCCVALVLALMAVLGGVLAHRGSGGEPPRAVPADQPGPVLLVPGYGGSTSGLAVLAARLRQHGKDAEVVSLPGNAQGDLAAQADVLAAAARAAVARTGAPSVDVVGYSAGGVVARLWLSGDRGAPVRRVVSLGSPQHGTALASLGALVAGQCPLACQQLDPASDLLARLNGRPGRSGGSGGEVPSGPVFVSLWTSSDEVVIPPESAVLAGGINIRIQDVCPASAVGHGGLPGDPLVAAMVLAELQPSDPVQLTARDCARLSS